MPSKKSSKQNKKNASKKKAPPKKKRPVKESRSIAEQVLDAGLILEACGNDEEVAQFYLVWLQNGHNATKAYLALHPNVSEISARTLGWRLLTKVDKCEIAKSYGIGYDEYFAQLKNGMNAMKGKGKPDHKVRRAYHEAAGKILGIEEKNSGGNTAVQVNVNKVVDDWIVKD